MKQAFLILLALFTLASCKLTQQYRFNLDFSGDYKLTFDVSELAAASTGDDDTLEDFFADMNLDSLAQVYRSVEGIDDVSIEKDSNVLYISYSFRDLDALNRSLQQQENPELGMGGEREKFKYSEGVFSYNIGGLDNTAQSDSLAEMMNFVEYDINMHFAKKIKEANNGSISDDERSVTMEGSFGEVLKKEKSLDLDVRFKTFADEKWFYHFTYGIGIVFSDYKKNNIRWDQQFFQPY